MERDYDAFVIGSGVNGLSAAIVLAEAGLKVLVREGAERIGGSCRTEALTLDGFLHDRCATVLALTRVSPLLKRLPLAEHGLELIDPPAPFAHPFDDGSAAVLEYAPPPRLRATQAPPLHASVDATAEWLGDDAAAWRRLMNPLVDHWEELAGEIFTPLHLPRHPLHLARFGLRGLHSIRGLIDRCFAGPRARGLFAGTAAHAVLPFDYFASSAMGLVLTASAHAVGWPVARGGAQRLIDAMAAVLRSHGGVIETGAPVDNIDEFPSGRVILADITPRQLLRIAGHRLPDWYAHRLGRFRYGPGAFKIDWALSEPIPWAAPACARAGTVHIGGTAEQIAAAEQAPWRGRHPERPYVLLVQPTLFDPTRAPPGRHVAWAYCHVPNGSTVDMTERIERQIERFAPGFRQTILARHTSNTRQMEQYNPNLVGGDINAGAANFSQLLMRPIASVNPYATPLANLYLCSASTPPGGGTHGMCGYNAATACLRRLGIRNHR